MIKKECMYCSGTGLISKAVPEVVDYGAGMKLMVYDTIDIVCTVCLGTGRVFVDE